MSSIVTSHALIAIFTPRVEFSLSFPSDTLQTEFTGPNLLKLIEARFLWQLRHAALVADLKSKLFIFLCSRSIMKKAHRPEINRACRAKKDRT